MIVEFSGPFTNHMPVLKRLVRTHNYDCVIMDFGQDPMLFLTFSVLVANPKKLLHTVANPTRGLLNREKITK